MDPDLELVAKAIGHTPIAWEQLRAGGYTRSRAWRVTTDDGRVFVKEAEDPGSLDMLRREALVYGEVLGSFLPEYVGFADSGTRAVLAIELLDDALWPPPYPDDVGPLFEALDLVAAATPPSGLPAEGPNEPQWERVAEDPEPFLGLRLCSREWLARSIDVLIEAEGRVVVEGGQLVHNDVYSANVAFRSHGAVLVDWGAAVRGSHWIDAALSVLSLRVEGATLPASFALPGEDTFAATIAGHFAVGAARPLPSWADPGSTYLEDVTGDLAHALRWAAEQLGLPPLS